MNYKLYIAAAILLVALFARAWLIKDRSPNTVNTQQVQSVQLITPQEFDQLASQQDTFIVDVHTPEQTHIPGTDAFIDYTKIEQNQHQLPENKDAPIIVYCRSGGMSARASQDLVELGYTKVYDLDGGTNAYKQSGMQSVTISPDTQPLGTVVYGDVPETEFILTNYTNKPLTVTRLSTSCGCTQAFLDEKVLEPFNSAPIKVTFDPAVHGDATDVGELTRTIYIETDHLEFNRLETTITATVITQGSL